MTPDTFVWTTFADFSHSNPSLEEALRDIRRLDFVSKIDAIEMKGAALDRFLFPVLIGENRRGVIMDLAALLKEEQRLTEIFGSAGPVLMIEEGKAFAAETLKHVRAGIPETGPTEFLDTIAAWLKTTGWGIFTFDTTKLDAEGVVSVTIREPPNSLDEGNHDSHFLNGMVVGIVELVFNRKASVTISRYDRLLRSLYLALHVPI